MSTLRKFQEDPRALLNRALQLFRSKRIRTAVVEGSCDKRFLEQWLEEGSRIRFDGFGGKSLVNESFKLSTLAPYAQYNFAYFFADVDYDHVSGTTLHDNPNFVYYVYCTDRCAAIYNDIELFLINTSALRKVCANLDVPTTVTDLRSSLESSSREFGSLRAADIIVRRQNGLASSVLDGLEIEPFFDASRIAVDPEALRAALPSISRRKEYVGDLIATADRLQKEFPTPWALSRGHDVTKMLALHMQQLGNRGITAERLELLLRVACEFREFQDSPAGRRIGTFKELEWCRHETTNA